MNYIDTYAPPKNSSNSYGISKVMSGLAEIGLIGVQARDLAKLFKMIWSRLSKSWPMSALTFKVHPLVVRFCEIH